MDRDSVPERPLETRRYDPAGPSRYSNLDKCNPEIQPNQYKAGVLGILIGLAPLLVLLIRWWLS